MNEKNKSAGINNMSNNISGGKQKVIKIPTIIPNIIFNKDIDCSL